MDPEASRTARESLDLAFGMSNILDTGLDRHTLSVLIALCDLGLNPEALAAVVKELQKEPSSSGGTTPSCSVASGDLAQCLIAQHALSGPSRVHSYSRVFCQTIYFFRGESLSLCQHMDPEASRTARESLDLAFGMSNILDTGLDRHTLSVLIALCDLGLNPEALAAVVKELQKEPSSSGGTTPSVN
uniref:Mitotic-spindle organizing protein 1B n=2 Tax=Daucus carota subsp. sativus TaxID=79200 RepID=A0A164WNZ7_DAUCS